MVVSYILDDYLLTTVLTDCTVFLALLFRQRQVTLAYTSSFLAVFGMPCL